MKLFVILSRFPYPLEKGDKLRAYHQLKSLSKTNEIILCTLTDTSVKDEWIKNLEAFCSQVHVFKLNKALIYFNTIKQVFTHTPYQIGYFYQRSVNRKIQKLITAEKPDHIYCQLIRTTEYVKNIHTIPKTLDYMDALGKGMYRRAEISSGIRKKLFQIEGKRLSEYENRIFDYFNHHTIISKQDRKFINHPQQDKIAIIENGISSAFSNYEKKVEKKYDLIFTGNMNYPPNVECACFIVNDILPILQKNNANVSVLLSGANPHQRITDLSQNKNVTVTGWVDDIRDSYAQGKLFVAPLFIGTGLQNKLLEAMAMGLPCITTTLANNALQAVDQESILIANNAEDFAKTIIGLLKDQSRVNEISEHSKRFVSANFNWDMSVEKLSKLMAK